MFEIGFSELVVIMVVALLVIGPEKLPKVARTLGFLWGKVQRYVKGVQGDIERDMQLDELRQLKLKMQQEVAAVEQSASQVQQSVDHHVKSLESTVSPTTVAPPTKPLGIPASEGSGAAPVTSVQQSLTIE